MNKYINVSQDLWEVHLNSFEPPKYIHQTDASMHIKQDGKTVTLFKDSRLHLTKHRM